jgi:hypothetical protein
MNTSHLKYLVLLGTLALHACRQDPLGSTGAQIDISTSDSRLYASFFTMSWMDEQNQLFQVRVPEDESMFIDQEQAPVVSVFIALEPRRVGMRRVLARGYRDGLIVSEGAARLLTARNVWVQLPLKMVAGGALPDQDSDGFPDAIDNCPRERDPCGGMPDAGVETPDAGEAAPDAGPDEAPDMLIVDPTNVPADAAPDLHKQDVRAS